MVLFSGREFHEFYAVTTFRIDLGDHTDAGRIELVLRHARLQRRVVAGHQAVAVTSAPRRCLGFCQAFDRDDVLGFSVGNLLSNGFTNDRRKRQ